MAIAIFLILCVAASKLGIGHSQNTFNVVDFGAVGDGKTENSQAFQKAWQAICGSTSDTSTLTIPNGTFLVRPLNFAGPCNSRNVHVMIIGKIMAPSTIDAWGVACQGLGWWICFRDVNNLVIDGYGTIDGQGSDWWQNGPKRGCSIRPRALFFQRCTNLKLSGLTHLNPPGIHIAINECDGISISNLKIIAPEDSPNTDGINIAKSTLVSIADSTIGTGDDCVAINGGCSSINITKVACGPGHGISIGSLGEHGGENDTVEGIQVRNCNVSGTDHGLRIKTTPGGTGYAKSITFEQITLAQVKNPIIIDQHYCNGQRCMDQPKAVQVSDVTYSGIYGTSASEQAITLDCSTIGCTSITLDQINIISSKHGKYTTAFCNNAYGTAISTAPNTTTCLLR